MKFKNTKIKLIYLSTNLNYYCFPYSNWLNFALINLFYIFADIFIKTVDAFIGNGIFYF
jgi:hypothetical protein